jgi:hypothetical protein
MYKGYKVRYVRNITDAGHFEEEGREAEDKISKKALQVLEHIQIKSSRRHRRHHRRRRRRTYLTPNSEEIPSESSSFVDLKKSSPRTASTPPLWIVGRETIPHPNPGLSPAIFR